MCCGHCTAGWPQPSLRCLEGQTGATLPIHFARLALLALGDVGQISLKVTPAPSPLQDHRAPTLREKSTFPQVPSTLSPGAVGMSMPSRPQARCPQHSAEASGCREKFVFRKRRSQPHPRMAAGTGRSPAAGHWLRLRDVPVPRRPAHIPHDALHHPLNALAHAVTVETSGMRRGRPGARPQGRPSLTR